MKKFQLQQDCTSTTRLLNRSTQKGARKGNMGRPWSEGIFYWTHKTSLSCISATRGERIIDTIKFFPEHVQMPKTLSADNLASATEDLIAILKKPHPPTLFLDQRTMTNDAIQKLQEIFTPRQQNEVSTRVSGQASTRANRAATRVELPIIDKDEIGTIIMKNYNNKIQ